MAPPLKQQLLSRVQQALAIDDLRRKIDVTIGNTEQLGHEGKHLLAKVESIEKRSDEIERTVTGTSKLADSLADLSDHIHARVRRLDDELLRLEEHVERLQGVFRVFQERITLLSERLTLAEPYLPQDGFAHTEPEYYLAAFLYNFLPGRVLVDVGANEGAFTEVAANAGYQVFAFEPFPEAFGKLAARTKGHETVKIFDLALGSDETTLPFYVAREVGGETRGDASLYNTFRPHFIRDDVKLENELNLPLTTLAALVRNGSLPGQIDFLKIDTEGFDLEVIKGLDAHRPSIVQTEFWGEGFVFVRHRPEEGALANSAEVIREMRARGYFWNLVIFRVEGENYVRYGTNLPEGPPRAWGNILFFQTHELFSRAYQWSQGALPRFQALT